MVVPMPFDFKSVMEHIASIDVQTLVKKDAEYGSSWKRRGGVGAFMMLARKWDRLETQATRKELDSKYDIFDAIEQDNAHSPDNQFFESTLETIRDLRRYLLLVESEIERRKSVENFGAAMKEYTRPMREAVEAGRVKPGVQAFNEITHVNLNTRALKPSGMWCITCPGCGTQYQCIQSDSSVFDQIETTKRCPSCDD
jgi:hypothetical protein